MVFLMVFLMVLNGGWMVFNGVFNGGFNGVFNGGFNGV